MKLLGSVWLGDSFGPDADQREVELPSLGTGVAPLLDSEREGSTKDEKENITWSAGAQTEFYPTWAHPPAASACQVGPSGVHRRARARLLRPGCRCRAGLGTQFLVCDHALQRPDRASTERAREQLIQTLAAHARGDGVWFDSSGWIVTARRR